VIVNVGNQSILLKVCDSTCKSSRDCSGDSKPTMSYIYQAMDKVKEEITKIFQKEESRYKKVWRRYYQVECATTQASS